MNAQVISVHYVIYEYYIYKLSILFIFGICLLFFAHSSCFDYDSNTFYV